LNATKQDHQNRKELETREADVAHSLFWNSSIGENQRRGRRKKDETKKKKKR